MEKNRQKEPALEAELNELETGNDARGRAGLQRLDVSEGKLSWVSQH